MATSGAATVDEYLAGLPPERRAVIAAVREVVRRSLPPGYEEQVSFGMIGWNVPLARYPDTYNKQPLMYAALAAQKNHYALYLTCAYQDPGEQVRLREDFVRAGKKLDMGKSCVRFKKLDDLPLDVIGTFIAATPVDRFIAQYEDCRASTAKPSRKG